MLASTVFKVCCVKDMYVLTYKLLCSKIIAKSYRTLTMRFKMDVVMLGRLIEKTTMALKIANYGSKMQNVSHVKLNFVLIRAGRVIFEGTLHTVDGPEKKVEFGGRPRGSPRVDFLKMSRELPRGRPQISKKYFLPCLACFMRFDSE